MDPRLLDDGSATDTLVAWKVQETTYVLGLSGR